MAKGKVIRKEMYDLIIDSCFVCSNSCYVKREWVCEEFGITIPPSGKIPAKCKLENIEIKEPKRGSVRRRKSSFKTNRPSRKRESTRNTNVPPPNEVM